MLKIIVVVDMQNDFITGSLGTTEAQEMLPRLVDMINAEDEDTCYIFTKDTHGKNYLDTTEGKKLPIMHCIKDTVGWEFPDCLSELFGGSPFTIKKSTFGSIDLMQELDSMIDEFGSESDTEIEFCGLCTDICVVSNALMAKVWFPDAKITVNASLCAGTTKETHEAALQVMQSCQIDVIEGEYHV